MRLPWDSKPKGSRIFRQREKNAKGVGSADGEGSTSGGGLGDRTVPRMTQEMKKRQSLRKIGYPLYLSELGKAQGVH